MIVCFDRESLCVGSRGGVARYFEILISGFMSNHELDVQVWNSFHKVKWEETADALNLAKLSPSEFRGMNRLARGRVGYELVMRRQGGKFLSRKSVPDLFHFTGFRPAGSDRRNGSVHVLTIQDMIPERLGLSGRQNPHNGKSELAKSAARLIAPSKATSLDVQEMLGIPVEKIDVIPHAVDHRVFYPDPNGVVGVDFPYALFVGSRNPYKGFREFLELISKVREKHDIGIVITGAGLTANELGLIPRGIPSTRFVSLQPSDSELRVLYSRAEFFVFPSYAEGFGLPVLEAMASGTPALLRELPVFREVGGDAASYFDDLESAALSASQILENRHFREDLVSRGLTHAKKFSWKNVLEETAATYAKSLKDY